MLFNTQNWGLSNEMRLYLGDLEYFLDTGFIANSLVVLCTLLALASIMINYVNYRNNIKPTDLLVLRMLSGLVTPDSIVPHALAWAMWVLYLFNFIVYQSVYYFIITYYLELKLKNINAYIKRLTRVKRGFGVKQGQKRLWPNGTVYYVIDDSLAKNKTKIINAMSGISKKNLCVKFKARSNEPDYVYIHTGDKCQSKIGRIGGKQDLQLAPNCFIGRKVTHELLHALGFNHEHSRPDRDDYVQVIMSNVKPGTEHNFEKKTMSMYKVYTKCYSYVGRIGGKQDLQLASNCFGRTIIHELLHALGFKHEHSRPDRDDYLQFIWANIKPGKEKPFQKNTMSIFKVYTKFDYSSIMLYGKRAFSKNNATTLISKQAPTNDIKYMRIMSTLDIFTLKAICYSYVGRIGGKQDLQLAPNCFGRTIIHELLHALGFKHEHSRPDRDDYLQVIWANIKPGKEKPFQKKTMPMFKMYTKFDYSSIMLYGKKAFSKNNATTLISKHAPTNDITPIIRNV
ncbi:unnamed protein product, partial [Medioppia subpectinata]